VIRHFLIFIFLLVFESTGHANRAKSIGNSSHNKGEDLG